MNPSPSDHDEMGRPYILDGWPDQWDNCVSLSMRCRTPPRWTVACTTATPCCAFPSLSFRRIRYRTRSGEDRVPAFVCTEEQDPTKEDPRSGPGRLPIASAPATVRADGSTPPATSAPSPCDEIALYVKICEQKMMKICEDVHPLWRALQPKPSP